MTDQAFTYAELVGQKVRLCPVHPRDAEAAYELLKDGVVARTLLLGGPSNVESLADSYRQRSERWITGKPPELELGFTIESLDGIGFLGSCGIRAGEPPGQWEIGCWLGEEYWGIGYVTDAARLVIHFAF